MFSSRPPAIDLPTGIVAIDRFNGTDTPARIWDAIEAKLTR
jgi:glutathione synthase